MGMKTLLIFLPPLGKASSNAEYETSGSTAASAAGLPGIMVAKSLELSYQELAKATNNFSLDNKIGQGGFGAVYFAELRGQVRSHMILQFSYIISKIKKEKGM